MDNSQALNSSANSSALRTNIIQRVKDTEDIETILDGLL